MKKILAHIALACVMFFSLNTAAQAAEDKENLLYLDTLYGRVTIKLLPDVAPNHVKRIKTLARQGFYNGQKFHRVIEGFMAQTGDPTGTGMGDSPLPDLKAEFSNVSFKRGTVGMARSQSIHSANSQFFICFLDCSFLDGKYTVFGQVIDGMSRVDRLKRGEPPANPDIMKKLTVAADEK